MTSALNETPDLTCSNDEQPISSGYSTRVIESYLDNTIKFPFEDIPKDDPDIYARKGTEPSYRFPDDVVYRAEICEAELESLVDDCKGDIDRQDWKDYRRIGRALTRLHQIEHGIERVLDELNVEWKECMEASSEASEAQVRSYNFTIRCLQTIGSSQTKELIDFVNEESPYDWEDKEYLVGFTQRRDQQYEKARMAINRIEASLTARGNLPWKEPNWEADSEARTTTLDRMEAFRSIRLPSHVRHP